MRENTLADLALGKHFVPPDSQTRSKASHNYALEELRGLAALWVAYAHVFGFKYELDPAYHPTFPFQGNISSLEIQQFTTPVFLPWNAADKLPSQLCFVLEGLWFIGLAILIFLVSLSMRNLFLGQRGRKDGQFKGR